jgi:hypothetical protein
MNADPLPGVAALMAAAAWARGRFTPQIALPARPRLNAGGGWRRNSFSLRLLTAQTIEEAEPLAAELESENAERKKLEGEILSGAAAQLEGFDFAEKRSIVLANENWNVGVLGLAASRLVERHNLPTVLLRREGDTLHGSCRSIPGVDIHAALSAVSGLLTRFGGHSRRRAFAPAERWKRSGRRGRVHAARDPECFVPAPLRHGAALQNWTNPCPIPAMLSRPATETPPGISYGGRHRKRRGGGRGKKTPPPASLSEAAPLPWRRVFNGRPRKSLPRCVRAMYFRRWAASKEGILRARSRRSPRRLPDHFSISCRI